MIRKQHIVTLGIFMLLFSQLCSAQLYRKSDLEPDERPKRVGIRAGLATNWLSSDILPKSVPMFGVQGGVYFRLKLGGRFHYQTELAASFKGSKYDYSDTGNYYTRLGLLYIELPQYLLINLDKDEKHNLMVGGSFNYLVRPSLFIANELFPSFDDLPVKSYELSLNLGYFLNFGMVGLQVAYHHGITNIDEPFENFQKGSNNGTNPGISLDNVHPSFKDVTRINTHSLHLSLYF